MTRPALHLLATAVLGIGVLAAAGPTDRSANSAAPKAPARAAGDSLHSSSWWLSRLPDGETKRKFILDCTGCHQFNETRALARGAPRGREQWADDVARMLRYAGARSGFPVIAADRDSNATAAWLHGALANAHAGASKAPRAPEPGDPGPRSGATADGEVREYDLPAPMELPHDLAVDASGTVIATGMFTSQMFQLDPDRGVFTTVAIPVEKANPRALEIDAAGDWWVVLGAPGQVARYQPKAGKWTTWPVGLYAHSLAIAPARDRVWFNGHFSRDPELMGSVEIATGAVRLDTLPPHPALADAGGPVPYELRVAPDGIVWMSELQGNRMVRLDPRTGAKRAFALPVSWSGPRRFDVDARGVLWIPEYANGRLLRFDPATERFEAFPLPIADALPYIARVHPRTGDVWIGTAAADAVLRFDPRRSRFDVYPLPTRGATVRHLAFDPRNRDVWLAYGASPALHPARIARLRPRS